MQFYNELKNSIDARGSVVFSRVVFHGTIMSMEKFTLTEFIVDEWENKKTKTYEKSEIFFRRYWALMIVANTRWRDMTCEDELYGQT